MCSTVPPSGASSSDSSKDQAVKATKGPHPKDSRNSLSSCAAVRRCSGFFRCHIRRATTIVSATVGCTGRCLFAPRSVVPPLPSDSAIVGHKASFSMLCATVSAIVVCASERNRSHLQLGMCNRGTPVASKAGTICCASFCHCGKLPLRDSILVCGTTHLI